VYDREERQVQPGDADLPGWQPGWTRALRDFQTEMEDAARSNRDAASWDTSGTLYLPVVGTDQRTSQSARITADGFETLAHLGGSDDGGDGTVPFLSAALVETDKAAMYSPQQHARIQNQAAVLEHLRGLLTRLHTASVADLLGPDLRRDRDFRLSYEGEDLYLHGEPIVFQAAMRGGAERERSELPAKVTLTQRESGTVVATEPVTLLDEEHRSFELSPPPAPGIYTIEVKARGAAPVSDVFAVVDPATS
jgi:hypothetical protein